MRIFSKIIDAYLPSIASVSDGVYVSIDARVDDGERLQPFGPSGVINTNVAVIST